MPKSKVRLEDRVRINAYEVLSRAVEAGLAYGWSRAHKHNDNPDPSDVREALRHAVMGELCDVLQFSEPADPE